MGRPTKRMTWKGVRSQKPLFLVLVSVLFVRSFVGAGKREREREIG